MTIADSLFRDLRDVAHKQGISLKQVVNQALRAGLESMRKPARRSRYRCPSFAMGYPAGGLDKALQLSSEIENEETARKLALRK